MVGRTTPPSKDARARPDPWNLRVLLYVAKGDEIKDAEQFTLRRG